MSSDSPIRVASQVIEETALHRSPSAHLRNRVLSGSMIMLVSSGFVGVMNLVYNFVVVHALGADGFGHANVAYTVLLLLASFTLSYQILCSKFVAKASTFSEKVAVYRLLHRRAWLWAIGFSLALVIAAPLFTAYLNLPRRDYMLMIAVASLFYIPLGVQRGFMQGMYNFRRLAANFALEVLVKVVGAIIFLALGWGVAGVILAIVGSIVAAYLQGWPRIGTVLPGQAVLPALEEGVQASLFFIGQMIIYNLDVILVQHFFDATKAGVYAAVAVVGRVVYMLCWSIVNGMFPFSAGTQSEEHGRSVLSTALILVVLIGSVFTLIAWAAPSSVWHLLLGKGFPLNAGGPYRALLALYAASTGIWLLSVVIMSYEISRKIGHVSWLQLVFSGAIVIGIYFIHSSLHDVIMVRMVLMIALLLIVSLPFLRVQLVGERSNAAVNATASTLKKIRRLHEPEVVAEFLKGEFHHPEYRPYRNRFSEVVLHPDLSNAQDNELRHALLFRRRGRMWRELPPNTEWWEVEIQSSDLQRIRIFPRSQWRKHSNRSYHFLETAERIRSRIISHSSDEFLAKLRSLRAELAATDGRDTGSAVMLIGIDERSPLTIIEGNHRMTAAALVSPLDVHRRFRFFCGFSPRMMECCWYQTDFMTLLRYAKNTVTWVFDKQQDVIDEAMQSRVPSQVRSSSEVA